MIALAFALSILGEKYILIRLLRRDLPNLFSGDSFTKQTLRFAWRSPWLGGPAPRYCSSPPPARNRYRVRLLRPPCERRRC